jgi:LmbE family N-acetylglucosaminyl deacetylase
MGLIPSPLTRPLDLPLYSIAELAPSELSPSELSVLVVAPHPDDETLGCGGAIALLQARGCNVQILVVSDGTQSHPHSRKYPAAALRQLREAETHHAMTVLGINGGIEPDRLTFWRLPDGAVPSPESLGFASAVERCYLYLERSQPGAPIRIQIIALHGRFWRRRLKALEVFLE